mmetsp:Transcript_22692/g.33598  ORF Transcript_22692/g.33598 Transcript_22692/m.33598 type:complete len:96 (-) Transcript_22692:289-576(-)
MFHNLVKIGLGGFWMGELRMMSAFKVLVFIGSVSSCSLFCSGSGRNGLRKVCRGRFASFETESEIGELLFACLVLVGLVLVFVFEFEFPILVADK